MRLKENLVNGGDHGADPFSFENKPVPKDMKIKMKSMKITVGYNKSDTTYGWNGFQNTFTLFYVHKSLEKSFSTMSSHSHPLIPGIGYFMICKYFRVHFW